MEKGLLYTKVTSALEARGLKGEASEWATKALYPPCPLSRVPMPALSTGDTLPVDYRVVRSVTAPIGLAEGETWDCMIITPPSDALPVYIVRAKGGVDFSSSAVPPLGSADNLGMNIYSDYATPSVVWWTTVNNTQVTGNTLWPGFYPRSMRTTYKSLTVDMTSSDLYNGGSMVAGQVPLNPEVDGVGFCADILGSTAPAPGSTIWKASVLQVPTDERTLSRLCPGLMSGPAKEGSFMVHKLTNLLGDNFSNGMPCRGCIGDFMNIGSTPAWLHVFFPNVPISAVNASAWSNLSTRPVFQAVGSGGSQVPWWYIGQANGGFQAGLSRLADTQCGVQFFRGLHPQASLQLTLYQGLEFELFPFSSMAPLVSPPARHSPGALDAYVAIARELSDCYPAKYNSLSALVPLLLNAIKTAAPVVMRALPSAIPVVKEIVDVFKAPDAGAKKIESRRRASSVRSNRSSVASSKRSVKRKVSIVSKKRKK